MHRGTYAKKPASTLLIARTSLTSNHPGHPLVLGLRISLSNGRLKQSAVMGASRRRTSKRAFAFARLMRGNEGNFLARPVCYLAYLARNTLLLKLWVCLRGIKELFAATPKTPAAASCVLLLAAFPCISPRHRHFDGTFEC